MVGDRRAQPRANVVDRCRPHHDVAICGLQDFLTGQFLEGLHKARPSPQSPQDKDRAFERRFAKKTNLLREDADGVLHSDFELGDGNGSLGVIIFGACEAQGVRRRQAEDDLVDHELATPQAERRRLPQRRRC